MLIRSSRSPEYGVLLIERIDGIVALIMALDCATRHADNYAGGSVWV